MSFSFNENTNSDDSCEINYFKFTKEKEDINVFKDSKSSHIAYKTSKKINNKVFEQLNLVKNCFSYDNNTHIGKEMKMNSEDAATEFTSNNYSTNREMNKTFTRKNTLSATSKYTRSPIRKSSNNVERIKNNKFFDNKKLFDISDILQDNNLQRESFINEEIKSIKDEKIIKPLKNNSFKRKSEIVSEYIDKLKEKEVFSKSRDVSQEERKSKFQIFESRINEGNKMRNYSKENEKIHSKKKKSVIVDKIRKSLNMGKNIKFSCLNDKGGVSCFNLLGNSKKDVKIQTHEKNYNHNQILIEKDIEENSMDSETSQLSNLTNVEIHENQYNKFNFRENIFINSNFQEKFRVIKNSILESSEINKKFFSVFKENYSNLQKSSLELQENFAIKENNERILLNHLKEIQFLEKKYNNLKYEMNVFSPTQIDKKDNIRINCFELDCQNSNNINNNINVSDSFNKSSNVSNMSSFFNNPNLLYNNEMNVDELIDELENKLSFIKLQNAQTMERLDYLSDEIIINERLNKEYVNKTKVIEKEISSIQKRKIFGNDKIKATIEMTMANNKSSVSDISIMKVTKNSKIKSNNSYLFNKTKYDQNEDEYIV